MRKINIADVAVALLAVLILSGVFVKLVNIHVCPKGRAKSIGKMERIAHALNEYKAVSNRYPVKLEVLTTFEPAQIFLGEDPFLDEWNRLFLYATSSHGLKYSLSSLGPDGIDNTKDDIRKESWDN